MPQSGEEELQIRIQEHYLQKLDTRQRICASVMQFINENIKNIGLLSFVQILTIT